MCEVIPLIISAVFLIIGIPLWIVGGDRLVLPIYDHLVSLPIYPDSEIAPGKIYISDPGGDSQEINVSLGFSMSDISDYEIYILHNMFGFYLDAQIYLDDELVSEFQSSYNNHEPFTYDSTAHVTIGELTVADIFEKSKIIHEDVYPVQCPLPTLITDYNNIQIFCKNNSYFMPFDSKYIAHFFTRNLESSRSFSNIYIIFSNSYFIPYNYYEVPEAYIFLVPETSKVMYIIGIVFTVISIIISIVYIFFCIFSQWYY